MNMTLEYGIDLGTTNSAIAYNEGTVPVLLGGNGGETTMPSAVHVKNDGIVITGKEARSFIEKDPANTAIEFKRLMGTKETRRFPASGKVYSPEELSSFILEELLKRAQKNDKNKPKAVVITIPAMFQLPQNEATRRAARLAGIEYAPLLQEPIAAAIAHSGSTNEQEGYWMIYDLGGGTFDVSLVRSREGYLQVIDHDGDNHLGGKDFDRVIAQEVVQYIRRQEDDLDGFKRSDPRFTEAFVRLKIEAERLRIFLSRHVQGVFKVNNLYTNAKGEAVNVEMTFDREKLEYLIRRTVLRTTTLCKELLSRNRLKASTLNGIVMVGGPTLTPCLPKILQEELKIEARHHMNPMDIVAYGAAIFASAQKIPKPHHTNSAKKHPATNKTNPSDELELYLEYEPMTTNPNPLLVGRIEPIPGIKVNSVRVSRQDKKFDTGHIQLEGKNTFIIDLELIKNSINIFTISLFGTEGQRIFSNISEITIRHGLKVSSPPLSQSIGVMLADNSVCWYLRKGVGLPAINTKTHAITVSLKRGQSGEAINVPLIQGESERADRNKIIGVLKIFAEKTAIDLPSGTEVKVTLKVDEFSHTKAHAYVPILDQSFEDVVMFDLESKEPVEVKKELSTQMDRLTHLEELAEKLKQEENADVDERIRDIEALIEEGDRDSIDIADQMVRRITREIDEVEDDNRMTRVQTEFHNLEESTRDIIKKEGQPEEERELAALVEEFENALEKGDSKLVEEKKDQVNSLYWRVFSRTPGYWPVLFDHLKKEIEVSGTSVENAKILIDKGLESMKKGDLDDLPQLCQDLFSMLPKEEQSNITSHIMHGIG
jgi:molecular chaperone DnaK